MLSVSLYWCVCVWLLQFSSQALQGYKLSSQALFPSLSLRCSDWLLISEWEKQKEVNSDQIIDRYLPVLNLPLPTLSEGHRKSHFGGLKTSPQFICEIGIYLSIYGKCIWNWADGFEGRYVIRIFWLTTKPQAGVRFWFVTPMKSKWDKGWPSIHWELQMEKHMVHAVSNILANQEPSRSVVTPDYLPIPL